MGAAEKSFVDHSTLIYTLYSGPILANLSDVNLYCTRFDPAAPRLNKTIFVYSGCSVSQYSSKQLHLSYHIFFGDTETNKLRHCQRHPLINLSVCCSLCQKRNKIVTMKLRWDWNWSHAYKGWSINSLKSRIVKGAMILGMWKANTSKKRKIKRRVQQKQQRLDKFHAVPTCPERGIHINVKKRGWRKDPTKYPNHFFVGTDGYRPRKMSPHDVVHVADQELRVVDCSLCDDGIFIEGKDINQRHDFVCMLIPRKDIVKADIYSQDTFSCLSEVERLSVGNPRGSGSQPQSETGHKYTILGYVQNRRDRGLKESSSFIKVKWNFRVYQAVSNLFISVEKKVKKFMHYQLWKGLKSANKHVGWKCFPFHDGQSSKLFPAMACGLNVFLPAHIDDDAFLSVTMTIGKDPPTMDSPISHYFCFPSHGVAVPLRPGDLLIFNPRILHCVSSRVDQSQHYFCVSFYLKTSHASGNDNTTRQLTAMEKDLLKVADTREKRLRRDAEIHQHQIEGIEQPSPKRQKICSSPSKYVSTTNTLVTAVTP